MRAFIFRRLEMIKQDVGDVVLLGSALLGQHAASPGFLARNGHPYSFVDLDRDAGVQELLDRFQVEARLTCRS